MKKCWSILLTMALLASLIACQPTATWQEQYDLGVRYLSEGNYEEAIIAFTAAIEIDPKREDTYLKLAEAYVALGDIDKAIEVLEQGIAAIGETEALAAALAALTPQETTEPTPTPAAEPLNEVVIEELNGDDALTYANLPELFQMDFDALGGLLDLPLYSIEERQTVYNIGSIAEQECFYGEGYGTIHKAYAAAPMDSTQLLSLMVYGWVEAGAIGPVGWRDIQIGDTYGTVVQKLGLDAKWEEYKEIAIYIFNDGSETEGHFWQVGPNHYNYSINGVRVFKPLIRVKFVEGEGIYNELYSIQLEFSHETGCLERAYFTNDLLFESLIL